MNENNANFTPAAPNFKTLVRMNFQGLTNFPYIEEDFDALTNYGLLSKVVEYLNKVISNNNEQNDLMTALYNAYVSLQDYVNNYFDNLDVQEEINNKLDSMAQDGSLYSIIRTYTDPIIAEQNARITSIENQVSSVASGSPLVASSTAGMIDTTKIYVNTTDGKWYYYDGDSWEIGGVYQSTSLADNSVTYENLESELKNTFRDVTDTTNYQRIGSKILKIDGSVLDVSDEWSIYEINVIPNETYKLHIFFNPIDYSDDYSICYGLFNNDIMVSYATPEDVSYGDNIAYYNELLNIPNGVNKLIINTRNQPDNVLSSNNSYILKVNSYEVKNINKNQLDSKLQTIFNDQYEEITIPAPFVQNAYFNDNGVVQGYNGTDLYSIDVSPNEKYKITARQVYGNPIIAFSGQNFNKTITVSGNSYVFNNMIDYIKNSTQNYQYDDYEFTIPEYCKKIYVSIFTNDTTFKIKKCTSYKIDATDVIQNYNKIGFRNWIAIGDSITEVNFRALHNYLYWVKNDIPDITITNKGASGTGYMNGAGTNNTFINRLNSISSYNLNDTIITVMGSINDTQYVANKLGQLGDTTTETLYGSMYQFFTTLFTKFNGVRVGCISPINWKNSQNSTALKLYVKALKETCELFNVPFLDMTTNTNLRPNNDTFLKTYYTADGTGNKGELDGGGVHPNSNGHRLFYARIKEFINTL